LARSIHSRAIIFSMPEERLMPLFLEGVIEPKLYNRWLTRKAAALVRRDLKRGHQCTAKQYRENIHNAVIRSEGKDEYTGETLAWELISTYNNDDSKLGKHGYKAGFALLPTIGHEVAESTTASFRICGWRTNDSKNDLSLEAFLQLCEKMLNYAGYHIEKPIASSDH